MRVAVDAMGGDHAPGAIVRGAVLARQRLGVGEVVLVGDARRVEAELRACPGDLAGVRIVHAGQVIGMGESPVPALKQKPDNSISVMVRLAVAGEVDAMVSAGNTGAMGAAATMAARLLPGVKRPGIAVVLPHAGGGTVLIDAGANVKCKPFHLYQYAVMGAVYTQQILGVKEPRVGLLSVGEEDAKGTDLVRHAHKVIKVSGLHFVGNVEGRDIHRGVCDVVVCDGFTGNVVLKLCEGLGAALVESVRRELGPADLVPSSTIQTALRRVMDTYDASTYGGAPLLGINGICLICHGRSDERAIQNAIKLATTFDAGRVNDRIVQDLEARGIGRLSALRAGLARDTD